MVILGLLSSRGKGTGKCAACGKGDEGSSGEIDSSGNGLG
jgi:hypothetical protein